ncbi:nuclear transport factor 2 family protein [Bradyrhizobium diazoefficiens]|uniref:nuclear transport factor 2 family protein n=1 Tax=Bradyrhizobium diazoefficiens TaxID=1355477 RepID=UPI00190BB6AF|nr:nuclear transport factor 2 family protein [Bradyrhizobium diazoefficiens]MBK3664938.1 nuclear transport factor 2 family protein [Bradyrhizobium diazoefficiens]
MAGVERTIEGPISVDTTIPDSALTREQIVARNLKVVEAHFHNETPETVEKAIALYGDTISWEAPTRGIVMNDKKEILEAYRAIFRTVAYRRVVPLRRFATEQFVFDDQIGYITVVGNEMPNIPYPVGSELAVRLTHLFEMKDGKIVREIAYEMWREEGAPNAVDFIPRAAKEIVFAPPVASA